MCGKAPKAPPPVVQRDPVKEQAEAEAKGQREANAETANRRRRRSWSASLTQAAVRSGNLGGGNNEQARTLLTQATPGG